MCGIGTLASFSLVMSYCFQLCPRRIVHLCILPLFVEHKAWYTVDVQQILNGSIHI